MANKSSGAFLPTTIQLDPTQIYETKVNSRAFKELIVKLYTAMNNISTMTNMKDSGIYDSSEFVTGQQYFRSPALDSSTPRKPQLRQVFRKVINFGALPNAASKSVAHSILINSSTSFTRIYGVASDTTGLTYLPLPYSSLTLNNNVEVSVSNTNVIITTGIDRTSYDTVYIVLEYLKF